MSVGGSDLGPDPYNLMLMSLGACISMTVRTYARHQGLALDDVEVRLSQERVHGTDCRVCEDEDAHEGKLERVEVRLNILGALTPEARTRLLEIAARSPIYRTLAACTSVRIGFEAEPPST
jgi:putative redox protein